MAARLCLGYGCYIACSTTCTAARLHGQHARWRQVVNEGNRHTLHSDPFGDADAELCTLVMASPVAWQGDGPDQSVAASFSPYCNAQSDAPES